MDEVLIKIGGIFNLGIAIFHLFFWRLFHWKKDLARITAVNSAIMQVMNLCLAFVFIVAAYISIFYSFELISTNLGRTILIAISVFWFIRFIEQIVFFGIKNRGSIAFAFLSIIGCIIYLIPLLS